MPVTLPSSTVSCVPDSVICRAALFVGQLAADHTCPLASAKDPAVTPLDTLSTNNEVLPSQNSIWQVDVEVHCV